MNNLYYMRRDIRPSARFAELGTPTEIERRQKQRAATERSTKQAFARGKRCSTKPQAKNHTRKSVTRLQKALDTHEEQEQLHVAFGNAVDGIIIFRLAASGIEVRLTRTTVLLEQTIRRIHSYLGTLLEEGEDDG